MPDGDAAFDSYPYTGAARVIALLKRAYLSLIAVDTETPQALAMIGAALDGTSGPVVEIGCGYGRYLRRLAERGIDAVGIDVNPDIIRKNRSDGLKSMLPAEFLGSRQRARVMLMAHVIEHFPPRELVEFMDRYLDLLDDGGHLVIATPLLTPHFYDDFDHVKPYHPEGLMMVFGARGAQVQYRSRNELELVNVAFRRSPWRATLNSGLYRRTAVTRLLQLENAVSAAAFRLSGGWIGRKTGWIGMFRKTGVRAEQ